MCASDKSIQLVQSLHQNMDAKICLNGKLINVIEVKNAWSASGLLHGTSSSAVQSLRPSNDEVLAHQSEEGYWVGVELKYKLDKKLFRRYTCSCNALQKGNECAFADDGALLYPSGQVLRWLQ